ncbi:methyltransferase domain-containing protein [Permianibacter sp. IMCC34836]|uniref:methyltransferase domain-containing protein n=1 Tax=Permianibacter fluminis TaxID=2738515 RepID=UPI001557C1FF|nr:methyltransferase domain-containing protein [Permianibacter fluminis]NQD36425.1 methyltransferase domain-containing protein [Permianibacter fluminis]
MTTPDTRSQLQYQLQQVINPALALLDLRSAQPYQQAHHAIATHLPQADLVLRRHELPLPGTPLQLAHDDLSELLQLARQLAEWGYPIAQTIWITPALLQQWQQQSVLRQGSESRQLWQANSSLRRALAELGNPVRFSGIDSDAPRALDLACGSGRDALALAACGYSVLAIDHKADALQRLLTSAAALNFRIETQCADIEAPTFTLAPENFVLISVARYLHRPLLPRLREWLAPGGLLVYETFARGAEKFAGPKRPEFLLEPGELAQHYRDWQILHDRIEPLADGRPMQSFIARKPQG